MSITPDEIARIKRYEGDISNLYLDINGNATIGYGHEVATAGAASALPFIHISDSKPATAAEKNKEWTTIKSKPFGQAYSATYYRQFCTLQLQQTDIDNLLAGDLAATETQLIHTFSAYATFPQPAQAGLIDMAYNLGIRGLTSKFPNFVAAVKKKDWTTAANECNRPQLDPNRNAEVKQLFLQAATLQPTPAPGTGSTGDHPVIATAHMEKQPQLHLRQQYTRPAIADMVWSSSTIAETAIEAIKKIAGA